MLDRRRRRSRDRKSVFEVGRQLFLEHLGKLVMSLCLVFTCGVFPSPTESIALSPVYWNISNPIFKSSRNDHIVFVNPFDEIDFVCPYYAPLSTDTETNHTDASSHDGPMHEAYLVYQVSRAEYDDCIVFSSADSGGITHRLILSCNRPTQRRRFTIWFDPFQSVPKVPEYKPGHSYYFITTSTGRRNGLENLYHGACTHHNMKLTIKIGSIVQNDDDVSDDDTSRQHPKHQHPHPHHTQQERQPLYHHHHHHQQQQQQQQQQHNRPIFRHEKGSPFNTSSSSSSLSSSSLSSSSSVNSRRNLSRSFPVLNFSVKSSTDPLPVLTTSGVPRDLIKETRDGAGQKGRTWVKDKTEDPHPVVRFQKNPEKTTDNEATNAMAPQSSKSSSSFRSSCCLSPFSSVVTAVYASAVTLRLQMRFIL